MSAVKGGNNDENPFPRYYTVNESVVTKSQQNKRAHGVLVHRLCFYESNMLYVFLNVNGREHLLNLFAMLFDVMLIPVCRILRYSLHGFVIGINYSKTWHVPFCPLEIVHK